MRRLRTIIALSLGAVMLLATPVLAKDGGRKFATTLTGQAEVTAAGVPNQGDLDGSGSALLRLNPGRGQVCFTITVAGVEPVAAAHIHRGVSTTTGGIVVHMSPATPTLGTWSGCEAAPRSLILEIFHQPQNFYVNVHNGPFPGGALRGQLG
jgi:hypothetical protein